MKNKFLISILLSLLLSPAWADERTDESVLLVKMTYSGGKWRAKPVSVLPCSGPSKANSESPTRSMFQLKSRDGKTLFRRYIENPRIILVEDPKKPARLLDKVDFTLRIPLRSKGRNVVREKDIDSFEFMERPLKSERPSTRLNMRKMMPRLAKQRMTGKRISCQLVTPSVDKLPELKAGPNTAISVDSMAVMLKQDRKLLMKWGIDNDVSPGKLKELVYSQEKLWPRLQLNKRSVESMLNEYSKEYKRR